eukprot:CAMPEP_0171803462 /NCGR_PEP_ID=MMETSP0991-20121206/73490_1 /TAXON_ID=483369 /ORGANISM="non described non described, Strain CCMP2098" /LENGTH=412 /DNA_ID=CAMNT_0012415569 /DNA_START=272 /DNA_END=1507 /DNA_ORIENTATION=+
MASQENDFPQKGSSTMVKMRCCWLLRALALLSQAASALPATNSPPDRAFYFDPHAPFVHIHIPKCAGGSAQANMRALILPQNGSLLGGETCFIFEEKLRGKGSQKNSLAPGQGQFLTLLRSPRTHVVSQFFMLRNKGGWCPLNQIESGLNGQRCCNNFPDLPDREAFDVWLDFYTAEYWAPTVPPVGRYPQSNVTFVPLGTGNYLGSCYTPWSRICYTPWNLMSRTLTCTTHDPRAVGQNHRAQTWDGASPNLEEALQNLKSFAFVGLVELYSESMCLFQYRLSRTIPEECTCAHTDVLWFDGGGENGKHKSGGKEIENNESESEHRRIDLMTKVDVELFRAGVLRFVKELLKMEQEIAKRIICPSRFDILRNEIGYIPGLWAEVHAMIHSEEAFRRAHNSTIPIRAPNTSD